MEELETGFFKHFRPTSLLRRFASAQEVANLAARLCGEVSSATNGSALRVDGGVVNQIM
jgi:enoyl-[acyl-carrier-protein] reductase (NADH)